MTKRTRISKQAQRRRFRHWQKLVYYGAFWDACRPQYWLSFEVYWTYTWSDSEHRVAVQSIKPYVTSLHGRIYIPYVHVNLAFQRALQAVQGVPFHKAIAQLRTVDLRILLADKFKEYGESK